MSSARSTSRWPSPVRNAVWAASRSAPGPVRQVAISSATCSSSGSPSSPSAQAIIPVTVSRPWWRRVRMGIEVPDSSRQLKLTSVSLRSVARGTSRNRTSSTVISGAAAGSVKWTLCCRRNVVSSR
jgi:hypothetical protein